MLSVLWNKSDQFNDFDEFKNKANMATISLLLLISFIIEVLYWSIDKLFYNESLGLNASIEVEYRLIQPYFIVLYVVVIVIIRFLARRNPNIAGVIGTSSLLFPKIFVFTRNQQALMMLVFWILLFLVVSWFYLQPKTVLGVGTACIVYLIYVLLHNHVNIIPFAPFLWMVMVSYLVSIVINQRNYNNEKNRFELMMELKKEKASSEFMLYNDEMTGLPTRFALEKTVKELESYLRNAYIVVINLDDLSRCNEIYGFETGDEYLKVFSQIITFLQNGNEDMIVRSQGDEFVAFLKNYTSKKEIEDRLHRYNRLLKEELVNLLDFEKFMPNFSYGIANLESKESYTKTYQKAIKRMQENKQFNKSNLSYSDKYVPFIDYNALFDVSSIVAFVWRVSDGWPMAYVSDNVIQMLGVKKEELVKSGARYIDLIHPSDREKVVAEVQASLKNGLDHYEQAYRLRHADGKYIWVRDHSIPIRSEGKVIQINGTVYDISDIKLTEKKLYHSEKLSALGRLSGGIAHDMNNQLMMIGSMADMAIELDDIETYRKNNLSIKKAVEGARDLIQKLLEFSKHHVFELEKTEMKGMIKDLKTIIDHSFEKDIDITINASIDQAWVLIDHSLLNNVFINFCLNAREAMERGGILTIKLEKISMDTTFRTYTGFLNQGDYLVIHFVDSGEGIAENDLNRIFEPFYTTKKNGRGIGLSMAANIVTEHKGGINVKTEEGKGSTFSIYLPLCEKDERVMVAEKSSVTTSCSIMKKIKHPQKIMIVDDEPVLGGVMSEFLQHKGLTVTYFENPIEALAEYKQNHQAYDMVLLDIIMPKITGVQLFEEMMEIKSETKVIFLSGYSEGIQLKEEHKESVIAFLNKPINLNTLYNHIK